MQNVGTVVAIKRAVIDDEPLIERVVTLTGDALSSPGNFWARIGTPVLYLLKLAGFKPQNPPMVIMGGGGAIDGLYFAQFGCPHR